MTISIKALLSLALTRFGAQNIDTETAKLEAQLLLQHALNVNRAWLIAHQDENLPPSIHAAFRAILEKRLNGEPIAYVLGYREFYGLNLKVSADTLIPRADTETLVEAVLAKIDLPCTPSPQPLSHEGARDLNSLHESPIPLWERGESHDTSSSPSFLRKRESMLNLDQKMDSRFASFCSAKCLLKPLRENDGHESIKDEIKQFSILDLGTGTGAIALAVAKHRPHTLVTAVDASQAALDIAIENSQNLNINNVKFILSDWFSAIQNEKFEVIVSNPPYIEQDDIHLKQGDLRFEPLSALASGADGLDAIRIIISQAPQHLNPHGYLMLEHGYNQAEKVASLLKQAGFSEISHAKDLAGINRVTLGCL